MKLSVIAGGRTWHTDQLEIEAHKAGMEFELVDIPNLTRMGERIDSLGEVVIWRSSSLDLGIGRTVFVERLSRKRIVINEAIAKYPFVAHKLYQQKLVEPLKTVLSIPTYSFRTKKKWIAAIDNGILEFPMIMKANLGARGEKVFLIKDRKQAEETEVVWKEYIFQNFIENSGDYRVFVLGGVALGIMKRIAKPGEYRNNVSQGGEAIDARDEPEAEELCDKALSIASMFGLHMCGVDFIKDDQTGELKFLEINTVVQWQGMQKATGINVAAEIVAYAKAMAERESKPSSQLVSEYLDRFGKFMPVSDRTHYLTRRLWWTGEEKYKRELIELGGMVAGRDELSAKRRMNKLVSGAEGDLRAMTSKEQTERRVSYGKYPRVMVTNYLLYFWFVAKNIYGLDWRKLIETIVSEDEIRTLREQLINDEENLRGLATGGINFFYLSSEYLGVKKPDLGWLVKVSKRFDETPDKETLRPWVYSLTHIIIGESLFYTRKVNGDRETCTKILDRIGEEIEKRYFRVSLDMKMEYLVCSRLCNYESKLKDLIMSEAEQSLSPLGNFLVDTVNTHRNRHTHKLLQAEHRNVLYLMAGE